MTKEEILKIVRNPVNANGTVLSFPERGSFGNSRYRGNCSGFIHAFLIDQYKVNYLGEMYDIGGRIHYKDIVNAIYGYKKAENNNNLEAKVRQVLRMYEKTFEACGNGFYRLKDGSSLLLTA